MKKTLLTAVAVTIMATGGAFASTLTGLFNVTAYQITGANSVQSQANQTTLDAMTNGTQTTYSFTYEGALDFRKGPGNSGFKIGQWLSLGSDGSGVAGTGTVTGLDATFADLQLSKGNIGTGTATTTFFLFDLNTSFSGTTFKITHDDGVAVVDGTTILAGVVGPTGEKDSSFGPLSVSDLSIFYAATNSNPSILEVAAVPLPAGAWLMLAGIGGFAAMRRRQTAKA